MKWRRDVPAVDQLEGLVRYAGLPALDRAVLICHPSRVEYFRDLMTALPPDDQLPVEGRARMGVDHVNVVILCGQAL